MEKTGKDTVRTGTKTGVALGILIFLFFGLGPGFYLGSYAAMGLLRRIFDGHVQASMPVDMFVGAGIIIGVVCIAAVSMVVGSIFGTGIGYVVSKVGKRKAEA